MTGAAIALYACGLRGESVELDVMSVNPAAWKGSML
jgi:hypothetical protein